MARTARIILPHVAAHLIQRGNNRIDCFRAAGDYRLYLRHLRELAQKYECALHAYCLMTNHVHLLLTAPSAGACAGLMRDLGRRYVREFNRRYQRTGTLWEGRFRSCVAESARYVLACYRYIELNPVRAGMAARPENYPWSSHTVNIGQRTDALVSPHMEYEALAVDPAARVRAYAGLFEHALEPSLVSEIRKATHGGGRLGVPDRGSDPDP